MCQGCGTCVAACPAHAIEGTGFSDAQILAQIEGLLMLGADGAPRRRRTIPRPASGGQEEAPARERGGVALGTP